MQTLTKIEQRKQARIAAREAELVLLQENDSYVDYVLDTEETTAAVARLEATISRVNSIETITTNTGDKYKVNCYALPSYIFGETMSRVLGLATTSSSMFTVERQKEFSAITGVPYIVWANVSRYLGSPAYYSKGRVLPAAEPDYGMLSIALKDLAVRLNLPLAFTQSVNSNSLEKYFLNMEAKAVVKMQEFAKSQAMFADSEFTIED